MPHALRCGLSESAARVTVLGESRNPCPLPPKRLLAWRLTRGECRDLAQQTHSTIEFLYKVRQAKPVEGG